MKCGNCGKENPPNSKYCTDCGFNLQKQMNNSTNDKNNTNLLIGIGIVIIIILIGLLGIGIYGMMNENNDDRNTATIVNSSDNGNAENQRSVSGSWHKIGTYNGVDSDSITITTKGTKFKVTSTAMPIKNYATNYMYTTLTSNGYSIGSSSLDWGSKSAVATKSKTLEFSGSGTHYIDVNAYELQWWTVEVWEYY